MPATDRKRLERHWSTVHHVVNEAAKKELKPAFVKLLIVLVVVILHWLSPVNKLSDSYCMHFLEVDELNGLRILNIMRTLGFPWKWQYYWAESLA